MASGSKEGPRIHQNSTPAPRTLLNHQNAPQGTPKASKMKSQSVPEDPQTTNRPKKCNLAKTYIFTSGHMRCAVRDNEPYH